MQPTEAELVLDLRLSGKAAIFQTGTLCRGMVHLTFSGVPVGRISRAANAIDLSTWVW